MSHVPDCEFCRIVHGAEPARIVHADDYTLAFFPLNPATPGHTLVIPREHVADVFGLSSDLAQHMTVSVLRVAEGVREALRPAGMNLITSAGPAAQQTVGHLHIHILPREPGDRMPDLWPPDHPLPAQEADRLQTLVQAAIARGDGAAKLQSQR